jgi:hypothetical protein
MTEGVNRIAHHLLHRDQHISRPRRRNRQLAHTNRTGRPEARDIRRAHHRTRQAPIVARAAARAKRTGRPS